MKKIILPAIALLALLTATPAGAWSYNDGDVLLIFRESGHNDVEFDLGNVSQFLGQTNGYTAAITNWNSGLVTTQFGSDLTGVSVILAAANSPVSTTPTAWISSADPNVYAYNVSQSAWTANLHGTISSLGNRPVSPFNVPPAAVTPTNAYVIGPFSSQYGGASYDYIVTGGNFNSVATWSGKAPFSTVPVEQVVPGTSDFWQVQPTSIYPNSPADSLVGTFNITTNGTLTFVAGPRPSTIAGVSVQGNVSSIQFSTTVGNTYAIAYTNALGASVSAWPVDGNTLIGDGRIDTINHTNNNNSQEFYQVETH
jgi:hypothetical protein